MGNDECEKTIKKTEMIINVIRASGPLGDMDKKIFGRLVSRIWVNKEKNITYELVNGLKLTVAYKEVG